MLSTRHMFVIAQPICDKIWQNCAFYDTSMKFGSHLDFIITKKYLDIGPSQISPLKALVAIFKDGHHKPIFPYLINSIK